MAQKCGSGYSALKRSSFTWKLAAELQAFVFLWWKLTSQRANGGAATATSEIEIPGFRFVESAREELQAVCCPVVFEIWHESRYDFGITEHLQSDVQKKVTTAVLHGT